MHREILKGNAAKMDLPLPSTRRDYSPLSWEGYFDRQQFIEIGPDRFNVYFAGTTGPVLVLLHGAGHSALTWALCVERLRGHYRILAMDFRGHGALSRCLVHLLTRRISMPTDIPSHGTVLMGNLRLHGNI